MPDEAEIRAQLEEAAGTSERLASRWPHLSYEFGVETALNWVSGVSLDPPMDEDRPEKRAVAETEQS